MKKTLFLCGAAALIAVQAGALTRPEFSLPANAEELNAVTEQTRPPAPKAEVSQAKSVESQVRAAYKRVTEVMGFLTLPNDGLNGNDYIKEFENDLGILINANREVLFKVVPPADRKNFKTVCDYIAGPECRGNDPKYKEAIRLLYELNARLTPAGSPEEAAVKSAMEPLKRLILNNLMTPAPRQLTGAELQEIITAFGKLNSAGAGLLSSALNNADKKVYLPNFCSFMIGYPYIYPATDPQMKRQYKELTAAARQPEQKLASVK